MNTPCLLGIDIGTSVIKATIFDSSGFELATASKKVRVKHPAPEHSELAMEEVWQASARTIRHCIQTAEITPKSIACLGCAGQGDGLWRLDESGEAIEPAILWNDGRSAAVIRRWQTEGILHDHFEKSANVLWAGSTGAILKWIIDKDPAEFKRIGTIFNAKDWINYKLTGKIATDESDATIPFMDLRRRAYDPDLAGLQGISRAIDLLAPIGHSTDLLGTVTREASRMTGLSHGTPVVHGLLDVVANAVGADVTRAGQSFMILGTTLLNAIVLESPVFVPEDVGFSVCGAFSNQWLRILASEAGTPNLDWLVREFGGIVAPGHETDPFTALERLAAGSKVGSGGVIYHPFINGERSPFLNHDASSAFFGIRGQTSKSDITRAILEGSAMGAMHNLDSLGHQVDRIVVTGGGAKNALWCQIIADATGCRIITPPGGEFGTRGAGRIAGLGIGLLRKSSRFDGNSTQEAQAERTFEPIEANSKRYVQLFHLYIDLINRLKPFWRQHAELTAKWNLT